MLLRRLKTKSITWKRCELTDLFWKHHLSIVNVQQAIPGAGVRKVNPSPGAGTSQVLPGKEDVQTQLRTEQCCSAGNAQNSGAVSQ